MIRLILDHKKKTELMVCACAFFDPNLTKDRTNHLRPEHFSDELLQAFWLDFITDNTPTSHVSAALAHGLQDKLIQVGSEINSQDVSAYADAMLDDYYLLDVTANLNALVNEVKERRVQHVNERIAKLANIQQVNRTVESNELVDYVIDFLASINENDDSVKTRIPPLDYAIGGFERGELTMLAARPSMGKSSLLWQIAVDNATARSKVLFFSIEVKARSMIAKYALGEAGVSFVDMRAKRINEQQEQRIIESANKLTFLNDRLIIIDSSKVYSEDIAAAIKKHQPDMVIVDHLALVSDKGDPGKDYKRVGDISWKGKQMAKDHDCAMVYAVQLNRQLESRTSKVPMMSDLRDSGELEQNADVVLFLHRPDYYDNQAGAVEVSPTEIWVGKHRNAPRNMKIELLYNLKKQRFFQKQK